MAKGGLRPNSGRKVGQLNKATIEHKNRAAHILALLDKTIEVDIASLKAPDRAKLFIDLMEFVQPKLSRVENKQDGVQEISITFLRTL